MAHPFAPRSCALAVVALLSSVPAGADISGFVRDANTNLPIAGARVHIQADLGGVVATTLVDGSFTLAVNPADPVMIAASVTYDRLAPINYNTRGVMASNGDTGLVIMLPPLPPDNPSYTPQTVDSSCSTCHGTFSAQWATANHALAAQDSWVLDLFSGDGTPGGSAGYVYTDTHPGQTGFCATCHAPMADVFDPGNVMLNEVTDPAALEGVSCVACHQIDSVNENVDALHHLGNATYRFPDGMLVSTLQYVWGPLDDATFGGMRTSYAPIFSDSRFCASCHQYTNPNTGAPGQNTYREWLASPFAVPGPDFRSCQDCHEPGQGNGAVCGLPGQPERPSPQNRSHLFIGATPETLTSSLDLTCETVEEDGQLRVTAEVTNHGQGHSFPTGVSIRNALLVIEATYNGNSLVQAAGPTIPFWADDLVPGQQDGDYAGEPGKGFAKVLEGRINGMGPVERPVLFIDAEGVYSDTLIPSGATDTTEVLFDLPPGIQSGQAVQITARLLYRRAYRAIAVAKGWTETPQGGPVEIEVAAVARDVVVQGGAGVLEIPTASHLGLFLLTLLLAAAGFLRLRRRTAG